ncbi:DNA-binding LacI/PurR family transcriptional regulator [Kitasatospora gansuensis]|uniref:DNA-binding LacI/PurR family transcriptional regulator n=1 Tax=Kitasatospora gansuensis TaxID=258050 RepID=A0A7W7SJ31_9ACTN|nr:LacI family DNA-binding transcriptional regulator [Kitasatospora gansuensis]MBB4950216.1 DNA-binding LacI/PurR family transcriptional regulator [Kitasatospora gansuensis]
MSEALARRAATLEDVARAAGVSRSTVSRVINNIRNVDPELQQTVRDAVAATGYVPNAAARALVTRRAGAVALVMSSSAGQSAGQEGIFTDPFFGRVVSGMIGALRPLGVHPVLMLADDPAAREQVLSYLRQGNADGAMLVSTRADDPLPGRLLDAGLPTVLFGRPGEPLPGQVSWVDLRNVEGGRLAAEHLRARGCRRIVTIAGPAAISAGADRLAGTRAVLGDLPAVEGDFGQASGARAMERLLDEHPDLDGVFAANDLMARGAVAVLIERGRRVPEDVAVIGFDDSSAATVGLPPLSTVRQPVEEMAAEMTRLLLDRIADPLAGPGSVLFDPELVIRESA